MATKVLMIGISGASCSGKTTIVRNLLEILPKCLVVHQDDFFKPEVEIPIDDATGLANWDCPDALDFPALVRVLQAARDDGQLPQSYDSKEHLNAIPNPVSIERPGLRDELRARVQNAMRRSKGADSYDDASNREDGRIDENGRNATHENSNHDDWTFVLVDGFMLYWHHSIIERLDLKLFTRAGVESLRKRRLARVGYVTLEGYWIDPPNYFDDIVYPNYVKFHEHLFDGRRERGVSIDDLVVLDSDDRMLDDNIEKAVIAVVKAIEEQVQRSEK